MMPCKSLSKLAPYCPDERFNSQAVLDILNSTAIIQDGKVQIRLLKELVREYARLEKKVDDLLNNTLPEVVASEIKYNGRYLPRPYNCTILFSDLVGFTRIAEHISGEALIDLLDVLVKGMDDLVSNFKGTKIKTIGDAYMAVFGAPLEYEDHSVMAVKTGMAALKLLRSFNRSRNLNLQLRIGIHTGRVIAGVVGKERMQFDVFGDDVNIASRFESSGEKSRVNVSHDTYMQTRKYFNYEERGEVALKNKSRMKAYFATGER